MAPAFGRPHRHLSRCESTNTVGRELAAGGAPAGTVITTGEQIAGRGRRGNTWFAPPGQALLYSAVLRPLEAGHTLLPLAVPLAVCESVEAISGRDCAVKWPNDVWIDRRKCAGVLIEARPQDGWAVIGVGINLAIPEDAFPEEFRSDAISVGCGASVGDALRALNRALARWVATPPPEVLTAFARRDALAGQRITWEGAGGSDSTGRGTAAGVDQRGNLLVEIGGGETLSLGAGEVRLLRGASD